MACTFTHFSCKPIFRYFDSLILGERFVLFGPTGTHAPGEDLDNVKGKLDDDDLSAVTGIIDTSVRPEDIKVKSIHGALVDGALRKKIQCI